MAVKGIVAAVVISAQMHFAGRRCSEFFQRQRVRVPGRRLSQRDQLENETARVRHGALRVRAEHVSLRQPLHQALQHARYSPTLTCRL